MTGLEICELCGKRITEEEDCLSCGIMRQCERFLKEMRKAEPWECEALMRKDYGENETNC